MGQTLFETSNQLWIFLFTVYGGVVLGLIYDLLTLIRVTIRGKHFLTVLFDILYWVIATVLTFALLYYACDGEFQYYDVLGFALGAALWFMGPGKGVKWLHRMVMHGLHAVWSKFKTTGVYRFLFK